jgi:tRNA-2-methylthio-N6-dimethylallyladenosine synthase
MKKAYIKTFGCQMNVHDSEKMAGLLREEGYRLTKEQKEADVIIFNTCSIRQKAEQKFFSDLGRIKSLKKTRPELKVAVAGCIAQQMGESLLKRAPHVDYLMGPQNLHAVRDMAREGSFLALEANPHIAETELPVERKGRGRAWVSIMYGCDNFCTYCVVPYTRGREKSRPARNIVREVEGLARDGYVEITLLGQNVNSYEDDTDFPGLLERLNSVPGIERIRFVTSHPRDLSDGLIHAMGELEKVCEHMHLPLQSGSNRILRAMNRRYGIEEYMEKVSALRRMVSGIAITSDIIAGFPGETGEDHRATVRALKEIDYDGIFAFKYSERPGTAASRMEGQAPEELRLERLQEILGLQDEITLKKNKLLENTVQEVLVEGRSENDREKLTGRTRTNKVVNFGGREDLTGRLINIKILRAGRHSLEGEMPAGHSV